MLTFRATRLAIMLSAALAAMLAAPTKSEAGCCLFDWMWGGYGCCRPVSCCYQPACSPCGCPSPCGGCATGACGAGGCASGQCGVSYGPSVDYGAAPSSCASGNCGVSYRAPAQTVYGAYWMAPLRPTPVVVTPAIQSQPTRTLTPADGPVAKRIPAKSPVVRTVSAVRERSVDTRPVNAGWVPVKETVTR